MNNKVELTQKEYNSFIKEAEKEGWSVFFTGNTRSTTPQEGHLLYEIQRIDEEAKFNSDDEAIDHVIDQAVKGSEIHLKALRWVVAHATKEDVMAIPVKHWTRLDTLVYFSHVDWNLPPQVRILVDLAK